MTKHFYAFGSICRGEIDNSSDIDLLACMTYESCNLDKEQFSIYSHDRIRKIWQQGNPFAWHLHLESRILFSSDGTDFIQSLGRPNKYTEAGVDCRKFLNLLNESKNSMLESSNSEIFNLSCIFLAARNFATCYSFKEGSPIFSRDSPLLIKNKLQISSNDFNIFARARILSTRGIGTVPNSDEISKAKYLVPAIKQWMEEIVKDELS